LFLVKKICLGKTFAILALIVVSSLVILDSTIALVARISSSLTLAVEGICEDVVSRQ
jgi:hypothetical protein